MGEDVDRVYSEENEFGARLKGTQSRDCRERFKMVPQKNLNSKEERVMKKVKQILTIIAGLWFLFHGIDLAGAKDPDYPTKPITLYIAYSAGGTTDLGSRAFIEAASKHLGQPFIPINKPGGSGSLAMAQVMHAKPDGYTLSTIAGSSCCVVPFSQDAPYKDMSGFTMLANFHSHFLPLMVRSDAPWQSWKEFLEWARKNPRAAKIGITGALATDFKGIYLWQIAKQEKVDFTFIAFKGSPELLAATLGGHITMYGGAADASTVPYLEEKKLRVLAFASKEKLPGYANIPSTQELYGLSAPIYVGVCGPKGLPGYVLKRLDDAFAKAVKDPEFIRVSDQIGARVVYMSREVMTNYVDKTFNEINDIMKRFREEESKR